MSCLIEPDGARQLDTLSSEIVSCETVSNTNLSLLVEHSLYFRFINVILNLNFLYLGIPDPIESCRYTYLNATLTVNCLAGFHQGDEDFFCYMYKRQNNGSYSEHARLKGLFKEIKFDWKINDFLVL